MEPISKSKESANGVLTPIDSENKELANAVLIPIELANALMAQLTKGVYLEVAELIDALRNSKGVVISDQKKEDK